MSGLSKVSKRKVSSGARRFNPEVALSLVQSFHRELDVDALLDRLFSQASAISPAVHMRYHNEDAQVTWENGDPGQHSVNYNLQFGSEGESGGELRFTAEKRFANVDLETLEDLITLAAPALTNALTVDAIRTQKKTANKAGKRQSEDALILLRLIGIDTMRESDPSIAEVLTQKLQKQILNGLREADGVFQIDDDHLAVLLPRTTREGAQRVARKVETLVTNLNLIEPELRDHLSVSVGISTTSGAASAEAVLEDAKSALVEAEDQDSKDILIH